METAIQPATSLAASSTTALLFLVALVIVAHVALRRIRRRRSASPVGVLEVVDRLPLEGNRSIWVVRCGGRRLVVGSSEAGLTNLGEAVDAHEPFSVVSGAGEVA